MVKKEEEYIKEKKIQRELLEKRPITVADSKWYIRQRGYENIHKYMLKNHDYSAYIYLPEDIKCAICYFNSKIDTNANLDDCEAELPKDAHVINQKDIFYDNMLEILRKNEEYKQALLLLNKCMKRNLCIYDDFEKKDIFFGDEEEFNRALMLRTDSPYFSDYVKNSYQTVLFLDSFCFSRGLSTEDICDLYSNPNGIRASRNKEKICELRNILNEKIFNARKEELIDICIEILHAAMKKNEQLMKCEINSSDMIESVREYKRIANIYSMFANNVENKTYNDKLFYEALNERIINDEHFRGLTLGDILSALKLYYISISSLDSVSREAIKNEKNQTLPIDMSNTVLMYKIPILLNRIAIICRGGQNAREKLAAMAQSIDEFEQYAKVAVNKFDDIYEWDNLNDIFEDFNVGTLKSERFLSIISGNIKKTGLGCLKIAVPNSDKYNEVINSLKYQIVIEYTIGKKNREAYTGSIKRTYSAVCKYLSDRKAGSDRYNNILILKRHLERLIAEERD